MKNRGNLGVVVLIDLFRSQVGRTPSPPISSNSRLDPYHRLGVRSPPINCRCSSLSQPYIPTSTLLVQKMDSTTADNTSKEEDSQSLDRRWQDANLFDKRITRTDFGPRPELAKVGTTKRVRTPDGPEVGRVPKAGRVKRLAALSEGRTPSNLLDEASGSQRPTVKQDTKELELVNAAKEGRSVTSHPIKSGSPWEHYIARYELNLDDHIYIVSHKTSFDTFMMKCLKGPDADKKVAMLERVQHRSFLRMVDCFNFEDSYYPVFPHMAMPLSQIIHSPPYPTEIELAAVLGQVRSLTLCY